MILSTRKFRPDMFTNTNMFLTWKLSLLPTVWAKRRIPSRLKINNPTLLESLPGTSLATLPSGSARFQAPVSTGITTTNGTTWKAGANIRWAKM